jgi:GTP-binding protein Era
MNRHAGYVALAGRPNVGKSSLLNRLLDMKLAITSHKPQTTRHSILGVKTLETGQIVYVDTPGIHQRGGKALNRYLNRTAHTALADVDLIVLVVQARVWTDEDQAVLQSAQQINRPIVLAVNKVDLVKPKEALLPYLAELGEKAEFQAIVPVSARNGENCDVLEQQLIPLLPESENLFPEDQLSDRPERFFAAELLREQLTRRYHKEMPYVVTVEIEKFEDQPERLNIGAVIWVERDSQRAILLGNEGGAMKETARAARLAMREFFDKRVHLEVWIKVKKGWSSDQLSLNQLGYSD